MEWVFYIEPIVICDEEPFNTEPKSESGRIGIISRKSSKRGNEDDGDDEISETFHSIPFFGVVYPEHGEDGDE